MTHAQLVADLTPPRLAQNRLVMRREPLPDARRCQHHCALTDDQLRSHDDTINIDLPESFGEAEGRAQPLSRCTHLVIHEHGNHTSRWSRTIDD